jgi:prophage antirepressor-like protein
MVWPEGKKANGFQRWLTKCLQSIGKKGKLGMGQEDMYAIQNMPPKKHSKVPATIPNVDDCISFEALSDQSTQQHRCVLHVAALTELCSPLSILRTTC